MGIKPALVPIFKSLPYSPLRITSAYGPRKAPSQGASTNHRGVDIGPDKSIGPDLWFVTSVANGMVLTVTSNSVRGYYIVCKHNGFYSLYQHLKPGSIKVREGQLVSPGDELALMGSSGNSTATHLHFELWDSERNPIDPTWYLHNLKGDDDMTEERVRAIVKEALDARIYTSDEASDFAQEYVDMLTRDGITTGERPRGLATREEVIVMLGKTIMGCVNTFEMKED